MAQRPNAYLETIIAFLLPYFSAAATDIHEARSEILDTLASYATRTRAEMLQAAHIIALGMTTLDVLAEAKTAEMSLSMRLRYRSCANSLNRSTLQTEKALDLRLGDEVLPAPNPTPEPINDLPEAELKAAIEQAQAEIDTHRNRAHPATHEERNKKLWAGAMIDALGSSASRSNPSPTAKRDRLRPIQSEGVNHAIKQNPPQTRRRSSVRGCSRDRRTTGSRICPGVCPNGKNRDRRLASASFALTGSVS